MQDESTEGQYNVFVTVSTAITILLQWVLWDSSMSAWG